jgi:hypothetical protein
MKWIQIAHTKRLNKTPKGWIVPSQSGPDCEMKSATKTVDEITGSSRFVLSTRIH